MQDTIVLFAGLIESLQKESTVFGGKKDRLAVVPADDDMMWMYSQNETGLPSRADVYWRESPLSIESDPIDNAWR